MPMVEGGSFKRLSKLSAGEAELCVLLTGFGWYKGLLHSANPYKEWKTRKNKYVF